MQLVTPEIGLFFWMLVTFVILLILMKKFAWKPILSAVNAREEEITEALQMAKKAREEMAQLKSDNEKIIQQTKSERDAVLKEARDLKEKILSEAKANADAEANKILENTKNTIEQEKKLAFNELKNEMAKISIDMAEKILNKELTDKNAQEEMIKNLITKLN